LRSRILLGTVFGAIGGFLGFAIQEPTLPHDVDLLLLSAAHQMQVAMKQGIMVGGMLGLAIGVVEGVVVGSPRLILRGALLGGVIGAFGGMVGLYVGNYVFTLALFGKPYEVLQQSRDLLDFVHLVIARTLGITFLGAFPGLAAGAATRSRKRAMHGLAGGLIGGFIGGLLFDLVATLLGPVLGSTAAISGQTQYGAGGPSRAIAFTLIGLLTGLFIGLVEEFFKQAWVRVLAGRNEGKDYILSRPMTILGRDERADVPLFGDPALAPQHAAIRMENGRHVLLDGGAPVGTLVNGQRIQQQLLRDGDMIQLGQVRILFREKATASKIGRPVMDAPKVAAQAPGALAMPSHLCPFCGAAKDASGNCLCTVPGTTPAGAAMPAPAQPVGAPYPDAMGYGAQPAPFGDAGYRGPVMGGIGSRLLCLDGPYAGQTFSLVTSNVTIGRDPARDIALTADTTVSRRHAHIAEEGGHHVVYDDGSSNGTFVNNVRVTIQSLTPGDIVQFGTSKFRYE